MNHNQDDDVEVLAAYFRTLENNAIPLENTVDATINSWNALDGWLSAGGTLPVRWARAKPEKP